MVLGVPIFKHFRVCGNPGIDFHVIIPQTDECCLKSALHILVLQYQTTVLTGLVSSSSQTNAKGLSQCI